jgi:flagellar hook-basal body complex protein FliE
MSIKSLENYNAFGRISQNIEAPRPIEQPQKAKSSKSFSEVMGDVIKEVDSSQKDSNKMLEDLVTGKTNVTVHDAMIAMQKADVAFQLMNKVRAKLVRAYEEILRTPV